MPALVQPIGESKCSQHTCQYFFNPLANQNVASTHETLMKTNLKASGSLPAPRSKQATAIMFGQFNCLLLNTGLPQAQELSFSMTFP